MIRSGGAASSEVAVRSEWGDERAISTIRVSYLWLLRVLYSAVAGPTSQALVAGGFCMDLGAIVIHLPSPRLLCGVVGLLLGEQNLYCGGGDRGNQARPSRSFPLLF